MEWRDEAIILGTRQHGETSAIVEVMTRAHGRHLGVVKGARSRRMQPMIQPGNRVAVHWWARLDEHLGSFRLETLDFLAAGLMGSSFALYGLQTVSAHLRLLPEREPHRMLYDALGLFLEHFEEPVAAGEILLRFEMRLLEELGFGLDLVSCAATGQTEDLVYVSPKSARAVSSAAGAPWKDKLLPLPAFLTDNKKHPENIDTMLDGFRLTGFFLTRHIWEARGMVPPVAREKYQNNLQQLLADKHMSGLFPVRGEG